MTLELNTLITFITSSVLLTLMPGPDILFVITQSITNGRKASLLFVCGLCTGLVVHVAAITLGLSALLAGSDVAFWILKLMGASYLFYLGMRGYMACRSREINVLGVSVAASHLYKKGILMNLLNPKVILFFLAFFPQFVDQNASHPAQQTMLLGALFIVQAFCVFGTVSFLSNKLLASFLEKPQVAKYVTLAEATIYVLVGVGILVQ